MGSSVGPESYDQIAAALLSRFGTQFSPQLLMEMTKGYQQQMTGLNHHQAFASSRSESPAASDKTDSLSAAKPPGRLEADRGQQQQETTAGRQAAATDYNTKSGGRQGEMSAPNGPMTAAGGGGNNSLQNLSGGSKMGVATDAYSLYARMNHGGLSSSYTSPSSSGFPPDLG